MCTSLPDSSKISNEKHENSLKSYNFDLDVKEIDKLFGILYEPDLTAFTDVFGYEREHITYKPLRRFAPYPVHQQLYMQQQQEQERRRQSLTSTVPNRITTASRDYHDAFKYRDPRFVYSDMFRSQIVRTVITFIDRYSNRLISTQNDSSEKCVVCMCNYQANQGLRELRCNHKFHRKCIDEWLVKSYICPVCRTDLTGTGKIFRGLAVLYHIWKEEGTVAEHNSMSTSLNFKLNENANNCKSENANSESNSCGKDNCSCGAEQNECVKLLSEKTPKNSGS